MRRHICPDIVREPKIVALSSRASAREAARLMNAKRVSSVLVMEEGDLKGIVTVRDIVRRVVGVGLSPDETPLGQIMTPNPRCVEGDESPAVALHHMQDYGFRHLPVVRNGRVIGVVVRSDFNPEEEACLQFEEELWQHMR